MSGKDPKATTGPTGPIVLPIVWHVPEDIISRFATNLAVQTLEGAFKLSFFEAKPEIRVHPTDGVPKNVRADCVASIIIPYEKLPSIIETLQKQLDIFNDTKQRSKTKA